MYPRAGAADGFGFGVVHLSDGVGEGAGGVDDALGLDVPFLAGQLISETRSAHRLLAVRTALVVQS